MKNLIVTVNGVAYNVTVEEGTGAPVALPLLLLPPLPLRLPAAAPATLLPLPPVPPVLFPSRLPCPATSWMSRSRQVTPSRLATLLILEAMKMENEISAPQDGTIASVNVARATPSTPATCWSP